MEAAIRWNGGLGVEGKQQQQRGAEKDHKMLGIYDPFRGNLHGLCFYFFIA